MLIKPKKSEPVTTDSYSKYRKQKMMVSNLENEGPK
jgi:hypothetical protein